MPGLRPLPRTAAVNMRLLVCIATCQRPRHLPLPWPRHRPGHTARLHDIPGLLVERRLSTYRRRSFSVSD